MKMPVVSQQPPRSSIVHRSESLRSEVSDASLQNKRVSFNRDVHVKRIPRGVSAVAANGHQLVTSVDNPDGRVWLHTATDNQNPQELLKEAETVLQQVDSVNVTCSPSPNPTSPINNGNTKPEGRFKKNSKSPQKSWSDFFSRTLPSSRKSYAINGATSSAPPRAQSVGPNPSPIPNGVRVNETQLRLGKNFIPVSSDPVHEEYKSDSELLDRKGPIRLGGSEIALNSFARHHHPEREPSPLVIKISSESPTTVSSISEAEDMATTRNPRVSSIVHQLSTRRESPDRIHLRSPALEPGIANTHNNNQPFSYISGSLNRTGTPTKSGNSPKLLRSPKEVIYAQVVVSGNGNGKTSDKRTVHTSIMNGHANRHQTARRHDSTSTNSSIHHYVYDKNYNNKENWRNGTTSTYHDFTGSKPSHRNNVTTVLLNTADDDDDFNVNNSFYSYRNRSPSPSPALGRNYYFGSDSVPDSPRNLYHYNAHQGSSFESSSPEVSPVSKAIPSARLVREADRKRGTVVSSAKLVSTFGAHHTDYNYMNAKLGEDARSKLYDDVGYKRSECDMKKSSMTGVSATKIRANMTPPAPVVTPSKYNNGHVTPRERSMDRQTNNAMNDKRFGTIERNAKNGTSTLKKSASSAGGIIGTLIRRKQEKNNKVNNVQTNQKMQPKPEDSDKEGKIKRQRAKFFSAFLDKNFTLRNNKSNANINANKQPVVSKPGYVNVSNSRVIEKPVQRVTTTDSEIEDMERRRDGEYQQQSWSSGEEDDRFGQHGWNGHNGQLSRGKSLGDFPKEPSWVNESDYRRNLATRYQSATLGRPEVRSTSYDASRSKSLDRRMLRDPPPPIIITPNTPGVNETDKWSNHRPLTRKTSGLSKSSYELDSQRNGKLRYFGDTDMEDANHFAKTNINKFQSKPSVVRRQASSLAKNNLMPRYQKQTVGPSSSLNSSESENGSRFSKGSGGVGGSQRSVYLHAAAVADIPATNTNGLQMQRRTMSKDELSNYSGYQKQSRSLARSMSVLAPWRPRHYREKYEVHYNNKDNPGRPPKPPRSPMRKSPSPGRAASSESLLRIPEERYGTMGGNKTSLGVGGGGTLRRSPQKTTAVSRSKSMPAAPKDSRLAGWLRRRKQPTKDTKPQ